MVIVILVLVLVLPPLFTSSSGTGGTSSKALSYDQARPIAKGAVANYQGGNWEILFASGYASNESFSVAINASLSAILGAYCTYTPTPGHAGNVTIPGLTDNRTSGIAPGWAFAFYNGTAVALVTVLGGHGTVVGTFSGGYCRLIGLVTSAVPPNVIDSTAAAQSVAAPSSAFRAAHPDASALFAIFGGATLPTQSVGLEWMVVYSTCTPTTPAGTNGYTFNATVNALNGTLLTTPTTSPTVCSGTVASPAAAPLGPAFPIESVAASSGGSARVPR